MDNKLNIWSSISSVLDGNSTEKEQQQVKGWMNEDKKNQQFFDRLKHTSYSPEIESKAAAVQNIIYIKTQEKIKRLILKRKIRLWQYMTAASVALLFVVGAFSLLQIKSSMQPVNIESKSPAGSTSRLELGDGTIVQLNAGSTINYPSHFVGDNRTVSLNGEAYFEVAKDAKHPFVVETNQLRVKVLGTHFNIKSYEDDYRVITTLMEGSVSVELGKNTTVPGKSVILKPNQQIIFDKETNKVSIAEVNASLYAVWKDGECFFEGEKLKDIAKILERQFGTPITIISPNLENQVFSGFFNKAEGLFHILNSFKRNRNLDYRLNDSGIEIFEINSK